MSTVSSHAFTYNGDQTLIGNSRFQSGMPDELSPAVAAEMDAAFNYRMPPNDSEIDKQYEAEMIRRDALASSAKIVLSVSTASGGKFAGAVRVGRTVHKCGTFKSETAAWVAVQVKAAILRREFMRIA